MTTEANSNTIIEGQTNPNAELRAYADRMKEERDAMYSEMMQFRLEALGLNPKEGLGKAIAKEYDGDISSDAIRTYLKDEYNYEPVEPTVEETVVTQAQERVESVMEASAPVTPEVEVDRTKEIDRNLGSPEATREDAVRAISEKLRL